FGACKLTKEAPPNLSADYLYPRQTAVVKQATETARNSVPSGGHSSSYLCQQDSVFAARDRFPAPVTHTHALFAGQSHSIPDNLVALLGHRGAWNCSNPKRVFGNTSSFAERENSLELCPLSEVIRKPVPTGSFSARDRGRVERHLQPMPDLTVRPDARRVLGV